jgi:VWFA-related protein
VNRQQVGRGVVIVEGVMPPSMKVLAGVSIALLGMASGVVFADPPTFRIAVRTVSLNVTVTGRQGYLTDLSREDFAVYEDGARQEVSVFHAGDVPLDLVLLLDLSASVSHHMGLIRSAAMGLLATLRPADRGAVIGFNDKVRMLAGLTDDQALLRSAVDAARPNGGTALYSAIYVAIRGLASEPESEGLRRRALVLLSDGHDTRSLLRYEDILEVARQCGLLLYTIRVENPASVAQGRLLGYGGGKDDSRYALTALARETGARAFAAAKIEELSGIYGQIAEELAHQYLLGYVPPDPAMGAPQRSPWKEADGFRRVAVAVPGKPGAQARTRAGYLADLARTPATTGQQ